MAENCSHTGHSLEYSKSDMWWRAICPRCGKLGGGETQKEAIDMLFYVLPRVPVWFPDIPGFKFPIEWVER